MGSFSADHRRWSSTEPLGYGAHDAVTQNPAGVTGSTTGVITTITPTAQAAANLAPAPAAVPTAVSVWGSPSSSGSPIR